tara:strand:+ start:381 stop:956 length:576 start_codon:yes stop_codon:yes gene_type:complete
MNLELMLKKQLEAKMDHPKGICISNIPLHDPPKQKNILVIPPGLGSHNLGHLKRMKNVTIVDGINKYYTNDPDSLIKFVGTLETIKPTMIIAGSRGTKLLTTLFTKYPETYNNKIILFGPVHLDQFSQKLSNRIKVTIVHGSQDSNEKIGNVRALVSNKKNIQLIEATRQGHSLQFEPNTINHIINYAYTF